MPRLIKLSKEKAMEAIRKSDEKRKKIVRKADKLNQYKGYITGLAPDEVGKFKIQDNKEYFAVRANIKRAAIALKLEVKIQKREDYIYFWKEE